MKILYVDHFHHSNSNFYWRDAFAKLGEVEPIHIDIRNMNTMMRSLDALVTLKYDFDHIHFGGSTKRIPANVFKFVRTKSKAPITVFYGDAFNNIKNQKPILKYIDKLYITNGSHLANEDKVEFILCPYDDKVFKRFTPDRQKDVIFIGNPYNQLRVQSIIDLSSKFNIDVFGGVGWQKHPINYKGFVSYEDYSKVLSQYKIALGDPTFPPCEHSSIDKVCLKDESYYQQGLCRNTECPSFNAMSGYFSNRLANTVASQILHCVYYVPGIEGIFTNHKDLVWVNDFDELSKEIDYYLRMEEEREYIAEQGNYTVSNYTFDNIVKKFIGVKK